jgi:hypothetical protein
VLIIEPVHLAPIVNIDAPDRNILFSKDRNGPNNVLYSCLFSFIPNGPEDRPKRAKGIAPLGRVRRQTGGGQVIAGASPPAPPVADRGRRQAAPTPFEKPKQEIGAVYFSVAGLCSTFTEG